MGSAATGSIWRENVFVRLFVAHAAALIGSGLSSVALGLLAHQLVGASASVVLGITLTIRIVVVVFAAPWAGVAARWLGDKQAMVACDLMRAVVVLGFLFVDQVWQIYLLAVFLNLGSALFTPVYKAVIPGVVSKVQYPKALAAGSIAYDLANIVGPSLAGLVIATVGFRGNFVLNAVTFGVSAALVFGLPRLALRKKETRKRGSALHGMKSMLHRWGLRESLFMALQVSIVGGFVLVATVDFVKSELGLPDTAYAWVMAAYGIGSVVGAAVYGRAPSRVRRWFVHLAPAGIIAVLVGAGFGRSYPMLLAGWMVAGAAQCVLSIRGNELLAANSGEEERSDIFAAHFSLSHVGWGLTYPLAGYATDWIGFGNGALLFAALALVVAVPIWGTRIRLAWMHRGLPDPEHQHLHHEKEPGEYHSHRHRHGDVVHSHPHFHDPEHDDS